MTVGLDVYCRQAVNEGEAQHSKGEKTFFQDKYCEQV